MIVVIIRFEIWFYILSNLIRKMEEPLIRFQMTGGLAYIKKELAIYPDGRLIILGDLELQYGIRNQSSSLCDEKLSSEDLRKLTSLIERVGFLEWKDCYEKERYICDGFQYKLNYRGKTIQGEDGDKFPRGFYLIKENLSKWFHNIF